MKTPMQQHLEYMTLLKAGVEGDVAYPDLIKEPLLGILSIVVNNAESMLEKEKEFMQKVYDNAKATGEMDEAVRTFNN